MMTHSHPFVVKDSFEESYFNAEKTAQLRQEFSASQPYKHIVMDNFLKLPFAESLYQHFPATEKLAKHYTGLNENKSEGANFGDFHPNFALLRKDLMSKEFADWVAVVTGLDQPFVTDDNLGCGLHEGKNGSFLDIHIDFNIHSEKNVHRRLNMLIYMNKDWLPHYGGELEMWNATMTKCEKKVLPVFNRAVIFETNEISYHGYGKITVPEGMTRKSIYTYFYTHIEENNLKYHDTIFKPRPDDSLSKKIATNTKEPLKNFVKALLRKVGISFK